MSEFKGTKGKWEYSNKNDYFHEVIIKEPNLKSLCAVNSNLEEVKYNALLISKAPEMLEMLKSLENDNNAIPELMWIKIKQLIKQATEI